MIQENYSFKYLVLMIYSKVLLVILFNVRPCVFEPRDMSKKDTITPHFKDLRDNYIVTIRSGRFQIERN